MLGREFGPTRAGRARAVAGVPSQPNVAYIGFDNGGVWRSTDYGSTWHPLFDDQSTGSIGAVVAGKTCVISSHPRFTHPIVPRYGLAWRSGRNGTFLGARGIARQHAGSALGGFLHR